MDLPLLLAAVERGDDIAALELLSDATADELAGDDAVTLLAAAARAGRHEVVNWLVVWDVDVTRPWACGVDPVTWAAESGMYLVLRALLSRSRDPLSRDSPHRRALRAAQDAIASGAGGGTDPPPAHRAVITDLEAELGIHRSPDELMARALVHADPDHDDWFASVFHLGSRTDRATFDWALEAAQDAHCPDRRRFGLDTMNFLAIGFSLDIDQDDDAELPFRREAEEFLRPLLESEQDPRSLAIVLLSQAHQGGEGFLIPVGVEVEDRGDTRPDTWIRVLGVDQDRRDRIVGAVGGEGGDGPRSQRATGIATEPDICSRPVPGRTQQRVALQRYARTAGDDTARPGTTGAGQTGARRGGARNAARTRPSADCRRRSLGFRR
ncbi:hypothetical protein [Kitasatospora cinereorecta]|uniref:Ankyrin repeat domain-containing protein n=1 Tax=Kitasatospora cinereorecta TaxID=285560 RepID=A0ABW0V6V5_9ACTN